MKVACLFGGYTSQFVGMGKQIYDESRLMQEHFEHASHCLKKNFVKLCFASSDSELKKMENAYTSLFLVNTALHAVLIKHGISFDLVCGYNDGEYSALCAAGSISLADGLYLLQKYCAMYNNIIENSDTHFMHIVGINTKQLQAICDTVKERGGCVQIIMYDGDIDHTIVGNSRGTEFFHQNVRKYSNVCIKDVPFAIGLHCARVDDSVAGYKMYLQKVDFKDALIPFISSMGNAVIQKGADLQNIFLSHLQRPLFFTRIIEYLSQYDIIVIPGKADVLIKAVQGIYPQKIIITIQTMNDIEALQKLLNKNK